MDQIDSAVAAAGTPAKPAGVRVRVSTGRIVTMLVPVDMTERERLDLIAYVAVSLPDELAKAAAPRPQILVPGHLVGRG